MKTMYVIRNDESGGALMVALIATTVLAGMAGAVLAVGGAAQHEHLAAADHMKALYVAEAGLSEGIAAITNGAVPDLGDVNAPITFSNGSYWGTVVDNGDDTTTLTAVGTSRGNTRAVEAILQQTSDGIYSSALFAGNSSGDPNYDLKFGGVGGQADDIDGNVYSGGNIKLTGTASIDGVARATGSVSGVAGESGITQPIPDIVGMDYANNNDVDVKAAFASATYANDASYGGKAWQLPESSPAHIFRKNPDDRASDINGTAKDDYFLEDRFEPLNSSATIDASGGSHITIAGIGGEPGANGNELVYYIDGNLWIHNRNLFSFTLWNSTDTPIKVTFVVKGNVYISDNIFYDNPDKDGLAMIAIKDPAEANSGNIYFGDPTFGTLEYMSAFMYAENNFYDNNLSASGSAKVTVLGNMTAGNQVKINRDFGAQHSKLTVDFDSRIWDGDLTLPGLPSQSGADPTWVVASWREVSVP
jgi:hypothetical protein